MTPIDALKQQEQALTFPAFDEDTAFAVGCALRAAAAARQAPVAIDIRSASRRLFYSALPGSAPENENWARRKGNVVLYCHASSLRVGLMLEAEGRSPWPDAALKTEEFAAHGGGFPVCVKGTGVVAAISISGLPSRDDHDIIVTVLARHLGVHDIAPTP